MKQGLAAGCLATIGCCGLARGDFSGPYAPENWTFTSDAGGFIETHTADTLVLVGGDIGSGGSHGDTDITILVTATGQWSFDWTFVGNTHTFGAEVAYYLVNGTLTILSLSPGNPSPISGFVTVDVEAGDVIGFRVESIDGVFGSGTLTITDFSAPVPAPAASLLLLGFGLRPTRQRQGDSA